MWNLDHKKGWALKNWCFQTVVLDKTLECPLAGKEIQPVNPKGNRSWIFIGRADAEAEAPILWAPEAKSRYSGKDSDVGKDRRQEEKGATENEMTGWHHQLDAWWASFRNWWWTGKPGMLKSMYSELDMTEWLNWTELACTLVMGTFYNIQFILHKVFKKINKVQLHDIWLGNYFLDVTLKHKQQKEKFSWTILEFNTSVCLRTESREWKRQPAEWKKIF